MLVDTQASNRYTTDQGCAVWFDAVNTEDSSWRDIEKRLASVLPADIRVEIWQATNGLPLFDQQLSMDNSKILDVDDFTRRAPLPGASIGPENQMSSGKKRLCTISGAYYRY